MHKSILIGRFTTSTALLALLALSTTSSTFANPVFQKETGLACAACHLPAQEERGRDGLNAFGSAFLQCGHKLGCFDSQTNQFVPGGVQAQGQVQYAPPPSQGQPQYAPPPSQGQPQYAPPPSQSQYAPPPSQGQSQYAPPPSQGQPQYAPPPSQPQYAPPPGQYQQPAYSSAPPPPQIPQGAYQTWCRELFISGDRRNLYGTCSQPNGYSIHTVLVDFPDCQSEIYLDVGYLRCAMRGGGVSKAQRFVTIVNSQSALNIDSVKFKQPNDNDWNEVINTPIKPHDTHHVWFPAAAACQQRIKVSVLFWNAKDDFDTCAKSKFTKNNDRYWIE